MAIEMVTSTPTEAEALFKMNHAYHTNYAWQMSRKTNAEELTVQFNRVRLPRQMLVQPAITLEERIAQNASADMIMVAMKDNNPIAYIALKENEAGNLVSIIDLVVRQNHRRKSVGSMLLTAAQDWTSHLDCQRLVINVTTKNDPAIALLSHAGFDYCGFHEFLSANHDIVLFYGTYLR